MGTIAVWMTPPSGASSDSSSAVDSIRASDAAGSGHPTSSTRPPTSLPVLLAEHLRYLFARPDDPLNDHLIFSKDTPPRFTTASSKLQAR